MVQRGFDKILNQIGTPAQSPVPRGNPLGRNEGQTMEKRVDQPIKFKSKKENKPISGGLRKDAKTIKPKEMEDFFQSFVDAIKKSDFTLEQFRDFLLKPA